ncbi:hypothetical protein [uncultured Nitratireductor sp.]|uniref:hypothetical protein n=1 Tax=uncultured Nitratireductor sp. TaxID=520953 RepID=UPI0025E09050|nr:hypothetical protein [uncultured Nitratireductor sp.]
MPPLLKLADQAAYRTHFERTLCQGGIVTHDGIPVFFRKSEFDHAFFESSDRRGANDVFSLDRAMRMDWIPAALADPNADCFQGWNSKKRCHDSTRRVAVVIDDFVIVIGIWQRRDRSLRANFITCYQADKSIWKIRQSPRWTLQECLNAL